MSKQDLSGFERLESKIINKADQTAGTLADNTGRTLLRWVIILIGIVVFFSLATWACSLGSNTANIVSFENFEEQHGQLHEDWESLEAIQSRYCAAQEIFDGAIERGASESTISQRESQVVAQGNLYSNIQADYDARMANFFETLNGFVAPSGLPDTAPDLDRSCGA